MGKRKRRRVDPTGELRWERLGCCASGESGGRDALGEPAPKRSFGRPGAL